MKGGVTGGILMFNCLHMGVRSTGSKKMKGMVTGSCDPMLLLLWDLDIQSLRGVPPAGSLFL